LAEDSPLAAPAKELLEQSFSGRADTTHIALSLKLLGLKPGRETPNS